MLFHHPTVHGTSPEMD